MSICDRCIHDEVCGLEDNHEDAMTFCADMKPKDILDKIRAEIDKIYEREGSSFDCLNALDELKEFIDKVQGGKER